MGHSPELLDSIRKKLEGEYPPAGGFEYVLERPISGTRMFPDIQVLRDGRVVCAVEIGYTRPEKLTAYRTDLKISDVRWYDKQGNLHGDVKEVVRVVRLERERPTKLFLYRQWGALNCPECLQDFMEDVWPDRVADRFERLFGRDGAFNKFDKIYAEACDYASEAVESLLLTDYVQQWRVGYCDNCDYWFVPDFESAGCFTIDPDEDPKTIARRLGPRDAMSWTDLLSMTGLSEESLGWGEEIDPKQERRVLAKVVARPVTV